MGAVRKHAGFKIQPKIDKNQFLKDIKNSISTFDSAVAPVEKDHENNFLSSQEQIKILKRLADAKDHGEGSVDEPILARQLDLKVTLLIHHVKPLVDKKLVHKGFVMGEPGYYLITQKGISFLVEQGLLK